jgi:putative transposase
MSERQGWRERTDNWKQIQQWCRWPEQRLYESIRPVILYGETPAERAGETSLPERTLRRHADAFDEQGMVVFLRPTRKQHHDMHRSLPVPMRQLIVDLKAEHPEFTLRAIAGICSIQFDRRPSHNTVKQRSGLMG